jgi:hypothetical protein
MPLISWNCPCWRIFGPKSSLGNFMPRDGNVEVGKPAETAWRLVFGRPAASSGDRCVGECGAKCQYTATVTSSARVPDSIRRTGRVQWR